MKVLGFGALVIAFSALGAAPGAALDLNKAQPVVTGSAWPAASVGNNIADTAVLNGATPGATGTLTFNLYGPDDTLCTGAPALAGTRTVTGTGGWFNSDNVAPLAPGVYRWAASYSGDASNNPAATPCNTPGQTSVIVQANNKAQTVVTGSAWPAASVGNNIADTAVLSGATAGATGTLTFSLYGPDDAVCAGVPIAAGTRTVNGNAWFDSDNLAPTAPGSYRWVASYSGDANNNPAATPCNAPGQHSVILRGNTVLTARATTTASVGGTVQDSATLVFETGVATGTISFSLYGPDDVTCGGAATTAGTRTVTGNGGYDSDAVTIIAAGTYRWIASYSGDLKNNPATSACNAPGQTSVVR
jgi:hypothetical protein